MQRPYTAVIFDLYGTLLDIHTDEEKADLWKKWRIFNAFMVHTTPPKR